MNIFEEIKSGKKKCLLLSPHPDDESIGLGGCLIDYAKYFDAYCISSSGVPSREGKYSAHERNLLRINEWNNIMENYYKIDFHPIYLTEGDNPPFVKNLLKQGTKVILGKLSGKKYDYIFVPNFFDTHPEHQFVTLYLLPKLLKYQKKEIKIVLYEVWALLPVVTDYYEITHCMGKKKDIIQIYKSQIAYVDFDIRVEGLNLYRGLMAGEKRYAEAFWCMNRRSFKWKSLYRRMKFRIKSSSFWQILKKCKESLV